MPLDEYLVDVGEKVRLHCNSTPNEQQAIMFYRRISKSSNNIFHTLIRH